jgi:putative Mg2+ transporter-C (MgtC) family protein
MTLHDELLVLQTVGPERVVQLIAAVICGVILGLDRRVHGSAAGVRTCTLVCLGAVLYTQVGQSILETSSGDPTRIPGQIITGIGFLGAGAILHVGRNVSGLTSAAVIWFTGAVGIVIGYGNALTGVLAAVGAVLLLKLLSAVEDRIPTPSDSPPIEADKPS